MAHKEQIDFCTSVKVMHPSFFQKKLVLDIGSLDINGNNQYLFERCNYLGVDLLEGDNVDFTSKGHELNFPDGSFDTIISTECFEHDSFYPETIKNIIRMLKPGGLFLFTCATTGRPEHGTKRTTPDDAPFVQAFDEWADYYKNLTEKDIRQVIDIENTFDSFSFSINESTCDLYFWGIKKGHYNSRGNYSFLMENSEGTRLINQLDALYTKLTAAKFDNERIRIDNERVSHANSELTEKLNLILNSRSWMLTKPLRALGRFLRGEHPNSEKLLSFKKLLIRAHNAKAYILRGDLHGLILRTKSILKEYNRARLGNITPSENTTWVIITTPHTLFIAHCIAEKLRAHGWSVNIQTKMPTHFPHDWYIVLCAQAFPHLPPGNKRIIYQLEQSVSTRWFTEKYLKDLECSLAVLDYSLNNLEYLNIKKIGYPLTYYVPIGASHTYGGDLAPEKTTEILFYGDSKSSPRRVKMLAALKEKYNITIANETFGEEMVSLIKQAKIVINIHYYKNALLETPRIQECLSLGTTVVSESSCDIANYPELAGAVIFFDEGSIQSMYDAIDFALDSHIEPAIKKSIGKSMDRFNFMFDRFLISMGFLPTSYAYEIALPLEPETDIFCLSLPETIQRRNLFIESKPDNCTLFDGMRKSPGWIGCGLSYLVLARHAIKYQLPTITIMEDDVLLPENFELTLSKIKKYLSEKNDEWDVFAGMIASLHDDTKIISCERHEDLLFVTIDRMTSTVMNIYNQRFLQRLISWNPNDTDANNNTIDRFIESMPQIRVVVTIPFLFGHREDTSSTLWGFENSQYREMISASQIQLKEKIGDFLMENHLNL